MSVLCPLCAHAHDTITRITGDVMLCFCGASLRVSHEDGGVTQLVAMQMPTLPYLIRLSPEALRTIETASIEGESTEDTVNRLLAMLLPIAADLDHFFGKVEL